MQKKSNEANKKVKKRIAEPNVRKIILKNADVACKKHNFHHVDLKMIEKHELMFYTKPGECLDDKRCDRHCKQKVKDILYSKLPQVLVCQKCLLSATTDDNGCTATNVFVLCYECKQHLFQDTNK